MDEKFSYSWCNSGHAGFSKCDLGNFFIRANKNVIGL